MPRLQGLRKRQKKRPTPEEYNADVMRGDYNDYPEHVREYAKVLRDVWMFTLPPKPKTKGKKSSEKGKYAFFIMSLESIKQSCAEFGTDVLVKLHADWRAAFRDGIAPYTIAQPTSLINVAAGKAREMREGAQSVQSSHNVGIDSDGIPETY